MRWAAYCRVSTEEQAERGTSLETQLERIKAAIPQGDSLVEPYIDDGYSAASLDRPHLQRLLADARAKQFDGVMVYKTDRLSRSIKDIIRLVLDEFMSLDIAFKSATEPYDTSTPQGRLFFTQLAGFADFEREMILERSTLGRLKRAKEGVYIGSHFVLGYRYDPETKRLRQVPEEADVVRDIFRMCNELNLGIQSIAQRLNRQGVLTPMQFAQGKLAHSKNGKLKSGKLEWKRGALAGRMIDLKSCRWTTGTIWRILTNPLYYGEYHYNRCQTKTRQLRPRDEWIRQPLAEPIIDREAFVTAQLRLRDRTKWTNRLVKHEYLLSGLLICAECGQRLHGVTFDAYEKQDAQGHSLRNGQGELLKRWKTTVYYRCYGRHAQSRKKCRLPYVQAEKADAQVWEGIQQFVRKPRLVLDQAIERQRGILSSKGTQLPRLISEKERELERVTQAIDKTLDAYTFGDLERSEFRPRIDKLRTRKRTLEAELQALRAQDGKPEEHQERLRVLQASLQEIREQIDKLNWHQRRDLLRKWITRIIVHPDGRLEVFGVIEVPELNATAESCFSQAGPRGVRGSRQGGLADVAGDQSPAQTGCAAGDVGRRHPGGAAS